MKNKLYICEHNIVISPKNQCIDCSYEELRETLIKGGLIVDDNKQNNEITLVNKKLCEDNRQLKNKISELEYIISNCKKENKGMKLNNERICSLIRDKNKTIDDVKTEIEEIHNIKDENNRQLEIEIDGLKNEIKNHEKKYKDLEDNYNKLFQLGLTNACDFTALKYEHETMKKDYSELKTENELLKEKYNELAHIDFVNTYHNDGLIMDNTRIKRELKHNNLKVDRLLNMNKELSNELEQSKKLFTKKRFISLGFTMLVIYLVIQFTLFLA